MREIRTYSHLEPDNQRKALLIEWDQACLLVEDLLEDLRYVRCVHSRLAIREILDKAKEQVDKYEELVQGCQ